MSLLFRSRFVLVLCVWLHGFVTGETRIPAECVHRLFEEHESIGHPIRDTGDVLSTAHPTL